MKKTDVDTEKMDFLANKIEQRANDIQKELDDLEASVAQLVGLWDGKSREKYHIVQRKLQADLEDLRTLLSKVSKSTTEISEDYVSFDKNGADLFL